MEISVPKFHKVELNTPSKTLMSAGPSNCSARVLHAMSRPILGHLHPETLKIMDDIKDGVRYLFQTRNPLTFCVSGAGHAGMETVLCNVLEDGDVILIAVTGIWGHRAADLAARYGADVRMMDTKPGTVITPEAVQEALEIHRPVAFFIVQGDSSTGVHQPLHEFGELCRKHNCLYIVDTVASLGSVELFMDKWQIDAIYTGSQKCLGAPAGITPVSFSAKSIQKIVGRNSKIKVYYFDAFLLGDYWNCFGRPRIYHHTISSTLLAGLREALAQVCEQGLENVIKRHQDCAKRLYNGLRELGLELYVQNEENRLPTVTTVKVPVGIEWTRIANHLMHKYSLELGGGLGPTAGQVWRIGLMGENATPEKVDFMLTALRESLPKVATTFSKM